MENNEAIINALTRWIENAFRNIDNIRDELSQPNPVNPITLSARMTDHYAHIEAWNEVLHALGHHRI